MSERPQKTPSPAGALRFHLAVQKSRLGVIALMMVVAVIARATGLVEFDAGSAVLGFSVAFVSVALFVALHHAAARQGWRTPIHYGWMGLDILLICWSIYVLGDSSPLWLIWFLTNATGAAFVAGRRAANAVILASCAAYLALLVAMGRIQGFDHELALAAGRLTLLFGGTYFMVRGIGDLRTERLRIAALDEEKGVRLEELQQLTAALDQRGRDLGEANQRILEANRAKSQFLANMSHELRTPLNSIIGFSEILAEKLAGRIEARFEKFLANILNSGRHLLGLINDILDLSKIEAGRMELVFEPVSLADVVHGVASVMHGVAAQRGIRLEVEIGADLPPLVADSPRLKQVLYNLVSNAVKFSSAGQAVVIRAHPLPPARSPFDAAAVELEVEDQGIGIRREDHQLIFEEFRQVDGGTTRNMGGTGLGLALVKRFVQMHGGRVEVDSEPGRGSRFRVLLPVDASRSAERRAAGDPVSFGFTVAEARAAVASSATPVLVAEDDEEFFRALAADLEAAGYQVLRARDGDEALALARRIAPAAITLDLVLPGRDGWEVLKELKSDPATAGIPVIIVSLIANHELGFALGAEDYFVKPLDRALFLGRLREIVAPAGGGRPVVLVIDDDPLIHDFLELELGEAGYEMLSAGGGDAGVAIAVARRPAVIVLDLLMEGTDGFHAATELQRRPETADIPILVFTSKELDAADRRQLAGRIAALLSKAPEDRRRVVATIRELDRRRAAQGTRT